MLELVILALLAAGLYAHVHNHLTIKQIKDDVVAEIRKLGGSKVPGQTSVPLNGGKQ